MQALVQCVATMPFAAFELFVYVLVCVHYVCVCVCVCLGIRKGGTANTLGARWEEVYMCMCCVCVFVVPCVVLGPEEEGRGEEAGLSLASLPPPAISLQIRPLPPLCLLLAAGSVNGSLWPHTWRV